MDLVLLPIQPVYPLFGDLDPFIQVVSDTEELSFIICSAVL